MARSKNTATKPAPAATPDLMKVLLDALTSLGVKPKVKWAPSRNYASLYVDGQNIGYVFAQTKRGMRIEPRPRSPTCPRASRPSRPGPAPPASRSSASLPTRPAPSTRPPR
jgi:hypothetical protein